MVVVESEWSGSSKSAGTGIITEYLDVPHFSAFSGFDDRSGFTLAP